MRQVPTGRAGGAVVQRRRARSRAGWQGANHSLYLSHQVWADLEALAATLGWSPSRTVDRLIALLVAEAAPRRDAAAALSSPALIEMAQRLVGFGLEQQAGAE